MAEYNLALIYGLLEGVRDPQLNAVIRAIANQLSQVSLEVFPLQEAVAAAQTASTTPPSGVTSFTHTLTPTTVRLSWGSSDTSIRLYEVRQGNDWATANFILRTPSLQADLAPIAVGTTRYLLKTINSGNLYSTNAEAEDVVVPAIGAPSVTATVIDNNVLLKWSAPVSSFLISHYLWYKNGVLQGQNTGTFSTVFETVSGTYTYGIAAVDVAGNIGPTSSVQAFVNQPPDFVLQDSRLSTLTGTKTNVLLFSNRLLCCVSTTETYENHFLLGAHTNKPWASPQEQIDSGYPYFVQPAVLTGSYQEVVDYGAAFTNVILNLSWLVEVLNGSFAIAVTLESSLDGSSWGTPQVGPSGFFTSIRYLRLTINFTGSSDTALMWFSDLKIVMDVKQVTDSGSLTANAGDADGTVVVFNKSFKDINSLTATPRNPVQPVEVITNFVDTANPTSFKVLAFDSSGNRVTFIVDWKARGVA